MLTNIVHRWQDIQKLKSGQMVLPSFVDFHTSNACNQHCVGCAYDGTLGTELMSEENHFKIVDQFIDMGVKAFDFAGGGEPTVLPYLPRLMRHITSRGAYFAVITNGTLLKEDLRMAILEGGTYVRVSLEASHMFDYATYKVVPEKQWNQVINNIDLLVEEKKRTGSRCQISLKFAVGKSLRGQFHYYSLIDWGKRLGVDRVNVKALRHEPEELSPEDRLYEQKLLDDACYESGVTPGWLHSWIAPYPKDKLGKCWLNPLHTVVDYQGNVWICCFFYFRPDDFLLGNMLDEKFEDIWFSQKHWDKLAAIKTEDCAKVDCKFFKHHEAVNEGLNRGNIYWL